MSILYRNVVLFAKTSNVDFEVYHIQLYLHRGSILFRKCRTIGTMFRICMLSVLTLFRKKKKCIRDFRDKQFCQIFQMQP